MKKLLLAWLIFAAAAGSYADECVILLHGLGRTSRSMNSVARSLKKEGYDVYSIDYPSTKFTIEQLAADFVAPKLYRVLPGYDKVYFVVHSMGGIILRYMLSNGLISCDRAVMLCTPNQGMILSHHLKRHFGCLWRKTGGPAGQQLEYSDDGVIAGLLPIENCELGIIAGDWTWEPLFSGLIPGDDDGKVAIEETKLPEMDDFIILHHTHTFIMNARDTKKQIISFLATGKFDHSIIERE